MRLRSQMLRCLEDLVPTNIINKANIRQSPTFSTHDLDEEEDDPLFNTPGCHRQTQYIAHMVPTSSITNPRTPVVPSEVRPWGGF